MQRTFVSFSFGCRVNRAEKEMLDREFLVLGFQYSVNNPNLYIINTCAVTQKAEREARQLIYQIKRKWPKTKVVVTGCAATKWIREGINIDGIDIIIDNTNKEFAAGIINQRLKQSSKNIDKSMSGRIDNNLLLFDKYQNSGRLLLKIQDGCQRFCTFCIVPYLRGQPKSVPINQIIKIIKQRTNLTIEKKEALKTPTRWPADKDSWQVKESENIQEVILTAINTQAYGLDTGESFIDLIKAILQQTKIARLSFGSIHPWSITKEFIDLYRQLKTDNRLLDYFHIPLQSGSNKILSLMKRGYTREEFIEKLNTLEKINPFAFIGTDIIVGFLEEKDSDFKDTYNFLSGSPIAKFHVFRFSKREKTAAFYMAKRLQEPTPTEKVKRAKALIELGIRKYQKFLAKHIGKTFPALFLERRIDNFQEVLLNNQVSAMVKTTKNLTGEIRQVRINSLKNNRLVGSMY